VSVIDRGTLTRALARPTGASSDFDLNPGTVLPVDRVLRPAGVLVAIWDQPGGARLILTKRSSHLKHHPGQIAFAGGKVDPGDDGPVGAALREAWEEIGLPPDRVQVVGTLPPHETVTGFLVTPVLAFVSGDFVPVPEAGEVDEVFTVPLSHVLDPANFRVERRRWRGTWRRYYAVPYGPYYIWGATARILRGLADRVAP
jgi:8-oxo-dGTP pyrophosphatase MutT (NUDIX family)